MSGRSSGPQSQVPLGHIVEWYDRLRLMQGYHLSKHTEPLSDGFGGTNLWQMLASPRLDALNILGKEYKGYLMIPPASVEGIERALAAVTHFADQDGMAFKFLLSRSRSQRAAPVGVFEQLPASTPTIVLYAASADQIQNVLHYLARIPEWRAVEALREKLFAEPGHVAPRRPGTNALIVGGVEFRTLCYIHHAGSSEQVLAGGDDWRKFALGSDTKKMR